MSATVIAFPQRPPRGANDYGWMLEASRRFALEQKIKGLLAEATPVKPQPSAEKEMLALLRRIDRRLAKMAESTFRGKGCAGEISPIQAQG